ncbi:MAG: DUF192 domain-containing protein [Candidatus Diapherotrites archaeon]|nr:DUF192 domain-containing protein [Candidatus Diapherotrites archaeon]
MNRKLLLVVAVVGVFILFLIQSSSPSVELITNSGTVRVLVEVADIDAERSQGLMFRASLAENAGMWFVFDGEKQRTFWMKNTLIPLDIIFVDSEFKVVDIKSAVPCESDPCTTYSSKSPAQFVLEVNAGFAKKHSLSIGDVVSSSG